MRGRAGRWLALLAPLLVLAALWAQPTSAFQYASLTARSVSATVATNASAYVAMTQTACAGAKLTTTVCTFKINNQGTTPLTLTAVKVSDPNGIVSSYSNGTSPTAVGSFSTVSVTLIACFTCTGSYPTLWDVTASSSGVESAVVSHYQFNATY